MSEDQRKKEERPENQDGTRLSDEEMAQVTGGVQKISRPVFDVAADFNPILEGLNPIPEGLTIH